MERTTRRVEADGDAPAVTFADVLRFGLRYGPGILGIALVGSLLAALWLRATTETRYRAHATLVIERSILGEDEPSLREFEMFRRILESDAVVAETRHRLVEAKLLAAKKPLRVGQALTVKTTTSKQVLGRSFTGLVPVLDVVVVMDDPDVAAATANLWTEIFLEHTHALLEGGQRSAVEAATAATDDIGKRIVRIEKAGIEAWAALDAESTRGHAEFDRKDAAIQAEHAAALDLHEAETLALLEQGHADHPFASLETRQVELQAALGKAMARSTEEADELAARLDANAAALRDAVLERDALADSRERSFDALVAEHERARLALTRQRRAFDERIRFERQTLEESVGREVEQLELLRRRLSEELAAAEVQALRLRDEPVRVVAPAVPPIRAEARSSGARAAAFGLGLALLGLLAAIARDVLAAEPSPPRSA